MLTQRKMVNKPLGLERLEYYMAKPAVAPSHNYSVNDKVDDVPAAETIGSSSIPGRVKPKAVKHWYSQLACFTFSNKRSNVIDM